MANRDPLKSPMTGDKVYGASVVVEVVDRKGINLNVRKETSPVVRTLTLQDWRDWCKKFNAVVVL